MLYYIFKEIGVKNTKKFATNLFAIFWTAGMLHTPARYLDSTIGYQLLQYYWMESSRTLPRWKVLFYLYNYKACGPTTNNIKSQSRLLGYNKLIKNLNQFRDFLGFVKRHGVNTEPRKAEKDVLCKTNISSCVCLLL